MIKTFVKTGLFVAMLLSFGSVQAQKFGYVNSAAILSELPEMKQLQSSLEAYENILKKDGEAKVAAFQKKQQDAASKKERGEMTPKEEETVTAELQKMQEDLYAYGQKMESDLAAKQQKDMEPILNKVNTAIQDVAKEGSYQYIFDAQSGILLYADEASDVTKQVKAKLGMQ
ncbi:MAG: OmpH family outer membrane protein [Saprospiraceae bacterium]|nr:OmpH family outer membrane protein [Saprospiraceae bacterium]